MKHDILFDEFTPLSFRENRFGTISVIPFMYVLEILVISLILLILPSFEMNCEQAPLGMWMSVMIALINIHLFCAALEYFLMSFSSKERGNFHFIFIPCIGAWILYGHYVVLGQGTQCLDGEMFLVCSVILGILDLAGAGVIGYYSWVNLGPSW